MALNPVTGKYTRSSNGGAFNPFADYQIQGQTYFATAPLLKQNVIASPAATFQIQPAQTGSMFLFDRASGVAYTLPPPSPGLFFDFVVTTTITSGAASVTTDAATTFLLGAVMVAVADTTPSATAGPKLEVANGTSTVTVSSNGTTSGGIKGQQYRISCVSATQWNITGFIYGSGTIITPFA